MYEFNVDMRLKRMKSFALIFSSSIFSQIITMELIMMKRQHNYFSVQKMINSINHYLYIGRSDKIASCLCIHICLYLLLCSVLDIPFVEIYCFSKTLFHTEVQYQTLKNMGVTLIDHVFYLHVIWVISDLLLITLKAEITF